MSRGSGVEIDRPTRRRPYVLQPTPVIVVVMFFLGGLEAISRGRGGILGVLLFGVEGAETVKNLNLFGAATAETLENPDYVGVEMHEHQNIVRL